MAKSVQVGECFAVCLQGGSFGGKEGGALAPGQLPISSFCCQRLAAQRTGQEEGDRSRKQCFKMWACQGFLFCQKIQEKPKVLLIFWDVTEQMISESNLLHCLHSLAISKLVVVGGCSPRIPPLFNIMFLC